MKHIDSRVLWLQDLIAVGGVKLKPASAEFGGYVDTHTKCEGTGGLCAAGGSPVLQ